MIMNKQQEKDKDDHSTGLLNSTLITGITGSYVKDNMNTIILMNGKKTGMINTNKIHFFSL